MAHGTGVRPATPKAFVNCWNDRLPSIRLDQNRRAGAQESKPSDNFKLQTRPTSEALSLATKDR